jgi:hypothetical protein
MAFDLTAFNDPTFTEAHLAGLVEAVAPSRQARHGRLWQYFSNPLVAAETVTTANSRPYVQAQEMGLPARITGISPDGSVLTDVSRKEVVIENDIAWRVHTMVDYLFGQPIHVRSLAGNAALASHINAVLNTVFEANGGMAFFQQLALLGAVHGFVDIALRLPADQPTGWFSRLSQPVGQAADHTFADSSAADQSETPLTDPAEHASKGSKPNTLDPRALTVARHLQLEVIDPSRVLPVLASNDYRHVRYWVQCYHRGAPAEAPRRRWRRTRRDRQSVEVVEILGPQAWQRYEDRTLVAQGTNPLGRIPVVHAVNMPLHGHYAGAGDVEAMIPLQDELNTRLSDRASRVTYQSFKMYLGKGIEGFLDRPVGPGQMWATHNLNASIEEFGHDTGSPSEDAHIAQVREALDKVSGVTPLAAGLAEGYIGQLTSGTALRVVLAGLLARTAKKRLSYGKAVGDIASLVLEYLSAAGVLPTMPADRRVEIDWPNPVPLDESTALANAQIKAGLGVSPEIILAELGYAPATAAPTESES